MEKILNIIKVIGATFVAVVFLFLSARILGFINVYKISSCSMYPALNLNNMVFASKLIKPRRGEIYCFKKKLFEENKLTTYLHRVIAVEGDTCEVKNGYAYVNGEKQDVNYLLAFPYFKKYDSDMTPTLLEQVMQNANQGYFPFDDTSYIINESEAIAKNQNLNSAKGKSDTLYDSKMLYNNNSGSWTVGNYGPVVVPKGKYFVLGDNRYNAYDSRYAGFIDESEMKEGVWFIVN